MPGNNGNGKPPEDDPSSIGNVLVELGICTQDQVRNAVEEQKRLLGNVLVDMGVLSHGDLKWALLYQEMVKKKADPEVVKEFVQQKKRAVASDLRNTSTRLMVLTRRLNKA